MDIWGWVVDYTCSLVQGGNLRLAQLLLQIPEATSDDHHAEADALVPEALARAEINPWAELFVRSGTCRARCPIATRSQTAWPMR